MTDELKTKELNKLSSDILDELCKYSHVLENYMIVNYAKPSKEEIHNIIFSIASHQINNCNKFLNEFFLDTITEREYASQNDLCYFKVRVCGGVIVPLKLIIVFRYANDDRKFYSCYSTNYCGMTQ